jgi:hypothetical protein
VPTETSSADAVAALEAFVVDNHDLEQLEAMVGRFNIFEAMRVVRAEVRHSDFLSFLLDPSEPHGLHGWFLKAMLKRVLADADEPPMSPIEIDASDLSAARVLREWRRIDVLVHDAVSKLVVVIENKIDSGEHGDQLQSYRRAAEREFPDCHKLYLYLTRGGDEPSDKRYLRLDYDRIAALVERAAHQPGVDADARVLMNHYVQLLRRHIVTESDIAALCQKIYRQHRKALDLIFEHRPDMQQALGEYMIELRAEAAESHGIIGSFTSKVYVAFHDAVMAEASKKLTDKGWDGIEVYAEFVNAPSQVDLRMYVSHGPKEGRQKVYDLAVAHPGVFRGCHHKLLKNATTLFEKKILTPDDFEGAGEEEIKDLLRQRWHEFLEHDLPPIRAALHELQV